MPNDQQSPDLEDKISLLELILNEKDQKISLTYLKDICKNDSLLLKYINFLQSSSWHTHDPHTQEQYYSANHNTFYNLQQFRHELEKGKVTKTYINIQTFLLVLAALMGIISSVFTYQQTSILKQELDLHKKENALLLLDSSRTISIQYSPPNGRILQCNDTNDLSAGTDSTVVKMGRK